MITQQVNLRFTCHCGKVDHWFGYIPLGASIEDIFTEWQYSVNYNSWCLGKDKKTLYCCPSCKDEVEGEDE